MQVIKTILDLPEKLRISSLKILSINLLEDIILIRMFHFEGMSNSNVVIPPLSDHGEQNRHCMH